jgi:hypothetical protein
VELAIRGFQDKIVRRGEDQSAILVTRNHNSHDLHSVRHSAAGFTEQAFAVK